MLKNEKKKGEILIKEAPENFKLQDTTIWSFLERGNWATHSGKISILENLYISPEEWLQFVVDCRRGIEHTYDIVEGPMADDQVWDYVEDYVAGNISKAAFWELVKFKYPTHQIVFCTEQALETISFEGSENL